MQKNGLFKQGVTHQGKTRGMRPPESYKFYTRHSGEEQNDTVT